MAFKNRIRLATEIKRPQFPEEREVFRKADGSSKTISAIIRKTYLGDTDSWPEKWHERFTIALSHDSVLIEGDKYVGLVSKDGDYAIDWPEFLDFPTSKASFTVQVTPFDATNSNCQSCEELSQVALEDNTFPTPLSEGQEYTLNVVTDDSICCYPAVFTVIILNSELVASATIDDTGLLTIVTQADFPSANGAELVRYRATCPNGSYDEATVYADMSGSVTPCLAPTQVTVSNIVPGSVTVSWQPVVDAVSYNIQLFSSENPGVPVQDITELDTIILFALADDRPVTYTVFIRTNCASGQSEFAQPVVFQNQFITSSCGYYKFTYVGSPANFGVPKPLTYQGCNTVDPSGGNSSVNTVIYQFAYGCLLESTPGVPSQWSSDPQVILEYLGLCLGEPSPVPFTIRNLRPGYTITQVIYDGVNLLTVPLTANQTVTGTLAPGANKPVDVLYTKSVVLNGYFKIKTTLNATTIFQPNNGMSSGVVNFNNITVDSTGLELKLVQNING